MTIQTRTVVKPPALARVLKYGMSGDDVKYVQEILLDQGYFKATPLGNFKALTKEALMYFQNTHIGEDGKFLEPDGKVGERTWWALHNPTGEAQRSFVPVEEDRAAVINNISGDREKFLKVCYTMHVKGIREIPDGSNYGGYVTDIVNACGFKYGIYWCLAAVSYAWQQAFNEKPLGAMHVGCATFWNEALDMGKAHPKATYEPLPGDVAIYNYNNGLLKNGRLGGAGHAGVVAKLSKDKKQFNCLEGNIGNRYKYSVRNVSEKTLVGYVNLFGDEGRRPYFALGITEAPVVEVDYAGSR